MQSKSRGQVWKHWAPCGVWEPACAGGNVLGKEVLCHVQVTNLASLPLLYNNLLLNVVNFWKKADIISGSVVFAPSLSQVGCCLISPQIHLLLRVQPAWELGWQQAVRGTDGKAFIQCCTMQEKSWNLPTREHKSKPDAGATWPADRVREAGHQVTCPCSQVFLLCFRLDTRLEKISALPAWMTTYLCLFPAGL